MTVMKMTEKQDSDGRYTCSMCGYSFSMSEAAHSCEGCPVSKITHCNRIRCPSCGFENVPLGKKETGHESGKSGKTGDRKGMLTRLFGRGK